MKFSAKQNKEVYQFITEYNSNEEFLNEVQNLYLNNTNALSLLHIYVLEEILRFGDNNIYKNFVKEIGSNDEAKSLELICDFSNLYCEDKNFRDIKLEQFYDSPETLSKIEMYALSILNNTNKKEVVDEEPINNLVYDNFTPILYKTDPQLRETITNLYIGKLIHITLERPDFGFIKSRQLKPGLIANEDKKEVIEQLTILFSHEFKNLSNIIDKLYVKIKFNMIRDNNGKEAFGEYLQYNTNIYFQEIADFANSHQKRR